MWMQSLLFPVPMALIWVILTNQVSLASFAIGYALSFGLALLLGQGQKVAFDPSRIPSQFVALTVYVIILFRDIFLSSVDVALRVMGFRPLKTGIIAVRVDGDEPDANIAEIVAGLSAHSITITPGELVVDYSPDHKYMYVHCLDVDEFGPHLDSDQNWRVQFFRRILGRD